MPYRPAGEPATLAAGSRSLGGAAGALRDVRARLGRVTSFEVVTGAWLGPASEAFLVDGAGLQVGLGRAADVLEQAAGALSELAARLEHAQTTWDRAQRLAAGVGVDLESQGRATGSPLRSAWNPRGGVLSPADAVDPAAMLVAGQAVRMAAAAEHEAVAARRAAAARLDQAARPVAASRPWVRGGHPPAGNGHPDGARGHGGDRHGGPVQRMVGRALEAGAEVATATHHLAEAAESRVEAAARLATTADDPAVRAAAGRVVQSAGQPTLHGTTFGMLPLLAPVLDFTASVSHGESLPRAFAGALGGAIGADLGGRAGMAMCGGTATATQGAGLIVCPTVTVIGGALGAEAGKAAALHIYDELTKPDPGPPHPGVRPGPAPGSGG
jgi:hypothetical protein